MRTIATSLILLGLAASVLVAPAVVGATPAPVEVAFGLPTEETGCGVPVDLVAVGKGAELALPDGRTLFTSPGLDVTVTNHDTGASVALNITGAAHVTTNADGSVTWVATGRNLLWGGVEDALVLTRGRFTWTFFPDGSVSPQQGTGHTTDVCALMA